MGLVRSLWRDYVPLRVRAALHRMVRARFLWRPIAFFLRQEIPFHGMRMNLGSPLIGPEVKASLALGEYEAPEVRMVSQHLRRDSNVIELGCSIGAVGAYAMRLVEPFLGYIGVEADPNLVPLAPGFRTEGLTHPKFEESYYAAREDGKQLTEPL